MLCSAAGTPRRFDNRILVELPKGFIKIYSSIKNKEFAFFHILYLYPIYIYFIFVFYLEAVLVLYILLSVREYRVEMPGRAAQTLICVEGSQRR